MAELISGTRVTLPEYGLEGWTEFPDPGQVAPDDGMVLVLWDNQRTPVWEYTTALTMEG